MVASLLAFCIFQVSFAKIKQVKVDSSDETIAETIAAIVPSFQKHGFDSITLVNKPLSHGVLGLRTEKIVTATLRLLQTFSSVVSADGISSTTSVFSRNSNVIIVDSYASFREIFLKINLKQEGYQGFFVIILTSYENQSDQMQAILDDLNSHYLILVNLIFLETPKEAKIFTFFPFTPTSCGGVHPVLLDTYINGHGFVNNADLLPLKTKQMFQCPIKVAAVNFPPFVILDEKKKGDRKFSGIDARVLKNLARVMNFSLKVETFNNTGWGELNADGNSSGIVEKIMNQEANITAGFFFYSEVRQKFMKPSFTYYSTKLVWVVNPGTTISMMQRLYKPFEAEVRYAILGYLIIGFLIIAVVERRSRVVRNFVFGRQVKYPTLQMINILVGGTMNKTPTRNFARTMLALYLFYTLVLRSAYTEALYRFLRNDDRSLEVQTMDDMLERNYTFLVPDVMKDYIEPYSEIDNRTIFFGVSDYEAKKKLVQESQENFALMATMDEVDYWNRNLHTGGSRFVYIKEIAFHVNLVFYMPKQSFISIWIDYYILKFNSNGYMEELENQYKAIYDPQLEAARGPKPLNMKHMEGCWEIFKFGLAGSLVGFLIELLVFKYTKK